MGEEEVMTSRRCALPGCNKPPWPSAGGIAPHLTCGNLHHQLLMDSRFNPARCPQPYQLILNRNADGLCALVCCEKAPWPGHSWCSRPHYLDWLTDFTSSLAPEQICRLPGCTRHVFVDENSPPSEFCGWRHCQKFVMFDALRQHHHQRESWRPIQVLHPEESPRLPARLTESESGHRPYLDSLMHSLKKFGPHNAIAPPKKNIKLLEDFYGKHPWEVFTEGHACWLIVRLKFTSKGKRQLTTKGHYHWKQSGRPTTISQYTLKYYTYIKRKGKTLEANQQHAETSYSMKEFTMEDVKWYSLIELVKEKPSSHGKLHKGQSKPQSAEVNSLCSQDKLQSAEVNRVCTQDMVTSNLCFWDNHMLDDSCFRQLTPLEDLTYNDFSNESCSLNLYSVDT